MNTQEIPVHILDNDDPTNCPMCGRRTEFIDYPDVQHHTCPSPDCGYKFIGEFDPHPVDCGCPYCRVLV